MPWLQVVAGPNGSGKSTLTRIKDYREVEIIDPDAIARESPASDTGPAEIAAAREALRRQRAALAAGRSFLVETTLAGRGALRLMDEARRAGYVVGLHFVCLRSADQAVDRVRNRVARGGHDVPPEVVRRRYSRSLAHLPLAIAQADESNLYDNSDIRTPHRVVAAVRKGLVWTAETCPEWATDAVSAHTSIDRDRKRTTDRGMGQEF